MIDSHCHLDLLAEPERSELQQARYRAGLKGLVIPGLEPKQWPLAKRLAGQQPGGGYALGIHPWYLCNDAEGVASQLEQLGKACESASESRQLVAIGECGLDGVKGPSLGLQQRAFGAHIDLANQYGLPLVVHSVKANKALQSWLPKIRHGFMLHGFYGSAPLAQQILAAHERSFIGIGAAVLRSGNNKLVDALIDVPLERLLIETDDPQHGQYDFAGLLTRIAAKVAEIKDTNVEQVIQQTQQNALSLMPRLRNIV
ncbi:TatD family hydrolase [Paraferrimonas sedimenticola]|uniref:Deoxyribonuclease n=1 Tax=Paraferrimonas sedimenticola TaxID=375674 RepID=A0AA37VZ14_9GAMM|nr:TatD family hydrolase [Paraferrimonas sedimenticola]GLP96954.1 deoxyribonuclease [Paraferrimonas sedimenticola]